MGMSTRVVGYRTADEEWKKMKAVWDTCRVAGVSPPEEVLKFFNYDYPGSSPGKEVNIEACVTEINEGDSFHREIDLSLLPHGVKFIRFTQSC